MYCTICQIDIDSLDHYKTELHSLNAKRRSLGYPPFLQEEFDSQSISDDLSIDLNFSEKNYSQQKTNNYNNKKIEIQEYCIFCDQLESISHYKSHGLTNEEGFYLIRLQCYICQEQFTDRSVLIKHIESEIHQTAVSDGMFLFLKNGKVLKSNKMNLSSKTDLKRNKKIEMVFKEDKNKKNQECEQKEDNIL